MPTRLLLSNPALLPVQAFFNSIGDDSFVRVIDCLTSGIGYSIDEADCTFPGDLDPDEAPFEGVRFSLFQDSIAISLDQLHDYLEVVCSHHITLHPETSEYLKRMLSRNRK